MKKLSRINQSIPFSILMFAIAFSGCGKSISKLTAEQKGILKETLNSASDSFEAPTKAAGSSRLKFTTQLFEESSAQKGAHKRSNARDAHKEDMANKIQDGLSNGQCENLTPKNSSAKDSGNDFGGSPASLPSLHIAGKSCPISFEMSMTAAQKKVGFTLKYKVQDPEYQKLSDINEAEIEYNASQESSESMSADFKGMLKSQKNGTVQISGTLKAQAKKTSELVLQFDFNSFTAELKTETTTAGTKYFLNREEVTKEELQEYVKSQNLVFN